MTKVLSLFEQIYNTSPLVDILHLLFVSAKRSMSVKKTQPRKAKRVASLAD